MISRRVIGAGLVLFALSGCSTWFGDADKDPLPGERVSVLQSDESIKADEALKGAKIDLPEASVDENWPETGGNAAHAIGHPALGANLEKAWEVSIGDGKTSSTSLVAQPVVQNGRIYAVDARARVSAIDIKTGKTLWKVRISPKGEAREAMGGGLAYSNGRLFATAGYAEVLCLDPANGGLVWRAKMQSPSRSAPTVDGGRVFVSTVNSELVAFDAADGKEIWTHAGLAEIASFVGTPSPAASEDLVVAAYASGELFGLRPENGRVVWEDTLAGIRPGTKEAIIDIRARPVIDRGLVVGVGHADRTVGIDARSGERVWQQDVGGVEMPWVAGGSVFYITNDMQLVALRFGDGGVYWVRQLDQYEDPDDKSDPILWTGPVLAGGRLILASSLGQVLEIDPQSGETLKSWDAPGTISIPPVVAEGTLLLLDDDGNLSAWR